MPSHGARPSRIQAIAEAGLARPSGNIPGVGDAAPERGGPRSARRSTKDSRFAIGRSPGTAPSPRRSPSCLFVTFVVDLFGRPLCPPPVRHSRKNVPPCLTGGGRSADDPHRTRSEEHTSELQSLLRTSYALFCLKKQRQKTDQSVRNNV